MAARVQLPQPPGLGTRRTQVPGGHIGRPYGTETVESTHPRHSTGVSVCSGVEVRLNWPRGQSTAGGEAVGWRAGGVEGVGFEQQGTEVALLQKRACGGRRRCRCSPAWRRRESAWCCWSCRRSCRGCAPGRSSPGRSWATDALPHSKGRNSHNEGLSRKSLLSMPRR